MVKKVVKWLFYVTLTLVLGISASLYLFKDRIIQQVLSEVNRYMAVPVNVSKVDIDFLHGLPNVSIAFHDVELYVEDEPIIEATKLYVILNPIQLIKGELNIGRIELVDADLLFYINKANEVNLAQLFKDADEANLDEEDSAATGFSLNTILLNDVRINYLNDFTNVSSKIAIKALSGSFRLFQGVYQTQVQADLEFLEHNSPSWNIKDVGLFTYDFDINYEVDNKLLSLNKSEFTFRGAAADLSGTVDFRQDPNVDLEIKADDISFKLLSEFLPPKTANFIDQYQSTGSIALAAELKGAFSGNAMPGLKAQLQLTNVDLRQQKFNANINDFNLTCQLAINDLARFSTGSFRIVESNGLLQDKPFSLTFALNDFAKPNYSGNLKADLNAGWLLAALQFENYQTAKGELELRLKLDNKKNENSLIEAVNLSGAIEFKNVSFGINDTVQMHKINGFARFNPNQIQLANLHFNWLSSDLTINGNIVDRDPGNTTADYTLRSDLKSSKLAIEDIVSLVSASSGLFEADTTAETDVQLDLDLFASLDSLTFRRFKGAKITGEVLYQNEVLEVIDLAGKAMGGTLKVNGKLKQMTNEDILIQANAKTRAVFIDSLFYVFNNFTQDFIRDENLKGQVYADVDASMFFDKNWRFRRQLLTAYAKIGIAGGELNNFAPIMALSPYLDDKEDNLSRLRFSELVNDVRIKEDTVFIPEMSIRTNVRNIALGGYHTLDQHINYQLAVPVINERVDKDEAFGAVQKSSKGSPNLLFRIKGTTSDYKVNYDLLRATGNVLKLLDITKIFKKKEEAEIDSSFLDDEEFDW